MEKRNQSSRNMSSQGGQSRQTGSSKQTGQQMKSSSGPSTGHTSGTREATPKGGSSRSGSR